MMTIYDFIVKDAKGNEVSLDIYRGTVLLIVNTATHCGFTPQYIGLQQLYDKYRNRGFEILDFPCNQFAHQAPETESKIADFCVGRFGITFKLFAKINVNGKNESPLFKWLKSQKAGFFGSRVKWNFTKFIIDRDGTVIARFAPMKTPAALEKKIERLVNPEIKTGS